MVCLNIPFLHDLLPSWLKCSVAIPSSLDQTPSSSRNTSLLEEGSSSENSSPVSHKNPICSLTEYMPGITVLPSPSPAYLFTTSKSAVHGVVDGYGYQGCEPFSYNRTPPIPRVKTKSFEGNMEGLPAWHDPSILFSPTTPAAYQPMNDSSQRPTIFLLWSSILIRPFKWRSLWYGQTFLKVSWCHICPIFRVIHVVIRSVSWFVNRICGSFVFFLQCQCVIAAAVRVYCTPWRLAMASKEAWLQDRLGIWCK